LLSATTRLSYSETRGNHTLTIDPAKGRFPGQAAAREWTVKFLGVQAPPAKISAGGHHLDARNWTWDAAGQTLTVKLDPQNCRTPLRLTF
jgi:hypothetical protein